MGSVAEPSSEQGSARTIFISCAPEDGAWADRLQRDLEGRGVHSIVLDVHTFKPGEPWDKTLNEILEGAWALVVLWTPRASEGQAVQQEIEGFDSLSLRSPAESGPARLMIPVFFGIEALESAPAKLRIRRGIVLKSELYASGPYTSASDWQRGVGEVARLLLTADESEAKRETEPASIETAPERTPAQQALNRLRAWAIRDNATEAGWLLGDELAVVLTGRELDVGELTVRTESGIVNGKVGPWPRSHEDLLAQFASLRLDPPLVLPRPPPIGPSVPGREIEVWGWPLTHPGAGGEIGEPNSDGSFDLELARSGAVENGSAVWDVDGACFVGIAVNAGGRRWCLMPVTTIRNLAEQAPEPGSAAPPSARIHDDSWTIDDRLDYALYARAIKEFIRHPDTKPPLVIGVQGPWGQGKTSLMRIAQERLDPGHADLAAPREQPDTVAADGPSELTFKDLRNSLDGDIALEEAQPAEIRSVWFNPWKYQSSEALWAGLAHSILTQLPARLPRRTQELFWLKLQLRRIDAASVRRDIHRLVLERLLPSLIASVLIAIVVGVLLAVVGAGAATSLLGASGTGTVLAAAAWFISQRKALGRNLEGTYLRYVSQPDYAGKLGYLHHVEQDMHRALGLLTPDNEPTVIFIDDLDRCSAAKISEVLEAINLFLSGEYPNCVFVLGIDAKVVASAMENVHREVLGEEEGKLGWRFLDKFIQLSFVMPRLSERQRDAYLMSLLGAETGGGDDPKSSETVADAQRIRRELDAGGLKAEDAARRVGELTADPAASESSDVRRVAEDVIALGARDFSDADPETVEALRRQLPHLSDNPRTIKRAVNLYRFYRFIAWAREASSPDLEAADPELIASWTVLAARWPQVVHWLQVNGREGNDPEALLRAHWRKEEPELCSFLQGEEDLDLERAMSCGLW